MSFEVNRRAVLNGASCVVLAGSASAKPKQNDREVLHEFGYEDVSLTSGPLAEHYNWIKAHYLGLDDDRMLKVFRQHAGLPAPGKDMGGWYDADGFVPGLTFGQYISGLSRFGRTTGDNAFHAKAGYLVEEFAKTVAKNPNPYPGLNSQNMWAAYVYDKFAIGLIDAAKLSHVRGAAELLPPIWEGCKPFISPVSRDRIGKKEPPYDETYVLSENLFAAADLTGDRKFRTLGEHYLLNKEFFDPLAKGLDVLPGKHAYSHAIALSSAAAAYLVLGDPKYKAALVNAWRFLESQRYASGGWGPEEQFVTLHQGHLYNSLFSTTAHFETPCGAYANTKLARYLLRFTGDARYGDGLERDLYNTILGTKKPNDDGDYPYYSTYGACAHKEFYQKKWPCCSGTLAQTVADYPLDIYFHAADRLVVNLYTSSEVRWTHKGQTVLLRQDTNFPNSDTIQLRLSLQRPERFTLALRIPAWIADKARILVNGQPVQTDVTPGRFAAVTRLWKSGDTVELTLPQNLRTVAIDDQHPEVVALMNGPVMQVAADPVVAEKVNAISAPQGWKPLPTKEGETPHSQTVTGGFAPFYLVNGETYDTYFHSA